MAINFELDDLQAFRAVAEMESFSKAAEAVHISQPAFSRRWRSWSPRSGCACSTATRAA